MKSLFEEDVKNEIVKDYNQEIIEDSNSIQPEGSQIQSSGSFYRIGNKIVTDIRLEFDVNRPKYMKYIKHFRLL